MTTSTPAPSEIPAPSDTPASFQIPLQAAETYESAFVPAFFSQWAPIVCDAAGIHPGQRVLDVACGTGIVARTAADRVDPGGAVTGIDTNEAMLTVARGGSGPTSTSGAPTPLRCRSMTHPSMP